MRPGPRLRLAIVTQRYPVASETFIRRSIEGLAECRDVDLTIGATRGIDEAALAASPVGAASRTAFVGRGTRPGMLGRVAALVALGRSRPGLVARAIDPVRYGRRGLRFEVADTVALARALAEQDVVHAQFLFLGVRVAAAYEVLGRSPPRLFVSVRGADATRRGSVTRRDVATLRRAGARLLPVSASLGRHLVGLGFDREEVTVVHSGIDLDAIPFRPRPHRAPEGAPVRLLFAGRLVPKKGVDVLIRALRSLDGVDSTLRIVGSGPERVRLERLARAGGSTSRVEFAGWVSERALSSEFQQADLLVVPSTLAPDGDSEGIPNVAKEAMASGLVVVASDNGGMPELITDGVSGFLFSQGDPAACGDAIRRAVHQRSAWPEIVQRARRVIEEEFDARLVTRDLLGLYRSGGA